MNLSYFHALFSPYLGAIAWRLKRYKFPKKAGFYLPSIAKNTSHCQLIYIASCNTIVVLVLSDLEWSLVVHNS